MNLPEQALRRCGCAGVGTRAKAGRPSPGLAVCHRLSIEATPHETLCDGRMSRKDCRDPGLLACLLTTCEESCPGSLRASTVNHGKDLSDDSHVKTAATMHAVRALQGGPFDIARSGPVPHGSWGGKHAAWHHASYPRGCHACRHEPRRLAVSALLASGQWAHRWGCGSVLVRGPLCESNKTLV